MVSCRCSLWYIHWISERLRGEYHWSGCEWRGIAVTMTFSGSNSLLQCYMYNQFVCVYCWWFHMLLLLIRYWLSDVYLLSLFITLWFIYNYNFMSICILIWMIWMNLTKKPSNKIRFFIFAGNGVHGTDAVSVLQWMRFLPLGHQCHRGTGSEIPLLHIGHPARHS